MLTESNPLEIHFIPYPWPSHLTSLFQIARRVASAGQHVTFFTTPANAEHLQESLTDNRIPTDQNITFHVMPFPAAECGLPPGVERYSDISDDETSGKLHYAATVLLVPTIKAFIERNPPDCIISDLFHTWSSEMATRLGIPRFTFHSGNVFSDCIVESLRLPDAPFRSIESDTEPFLLSDLPQPIILTRAQLSDHIVKPDKITELFEYIRACELGCYGMVVNGCSEFDGEFTEYYKKIMGHKRIWHLGPSSLIYTSNKVDRQEHECLNWLKNKQPNSVVYICFGSSVKLKDDQLYEIACGIRASGCNFVWVVHGKDDMHEVGDQENQSWLPEGFEEEMKNEDKGVILKGWAPQVRILESFATGAFLTHCGWNSIMEALISKVPLITWPMFAEQLYNEKLVTQVLQIGVEVGSKRKSLVKRESIEQAIGKVMHNGVEVAEMRQRMKELSELAKMAVQEGGSSMNNLNAMIEDLKIMKTKKML